MNPNEYTAAVRKAHEISVRGAKGVVKHRLYAGVTDAELLAICNALVVADDALMPLLRQTDDPLEPHPDPMRNKKDGVA